MGRDLTNGDTAALSLGASIRGGHYHGVADGSGTESFLTAMNGGASYWSKTVRRYADIYQNRITPSHTYLYISGFGLSVRWRKSIINHLSGSYGLAEGSGTNMDTAMLTSGFVRSGRAYYVYATLWERDLQGFYWTKQSGGSATAATMLMAQSVLTTNTRFDHVGTGFVVRCKFFPSSSLRKLWVGRGKFDERGHGGVVDRLSARRVL